MQCKRASGRGLGRVPSDGVLDAGNVKHIERSDLEVTTIKIAFMAGERAGNGLLVLETSAHVVVKHFYICGLVGETDWPVFGVVGNMPDAGGGFQQSLVAIQVKFWVEYVFDRISRIDWIDAGVLI